MDVLEVSFLRVHAWITDHFYTRCVRERDLQANFLSGSRVVFRKMDSLDCLMVLLLTMLTEEALHTSDILQQAFTVWQHIVTHPGRGCGFRSPWKARPTPAKLPFSLPVSDACQFQSILRFTPSQLEDLLTETAPYILLPRNVRNLYSEEVNCNRDFRPCKICPRDRLICYLSRMCHGGTLKSLEQAGRMMRFDSCISFLMASKSPSVRDTTRLTFSSPR